MNTRLLCKSRCIVICASYTLLSFKYVIKTYVYIYINKVYIYFFFFMRYIHYVVNISEYSFYYVTLRLFILLRQTATITLDQHF